MIVKGGGSELTLLFNTSSLFVEGSVRLTKQTLLGHAETNPSFLYISCLESILL
jgi:hypothetical protein